ncbi:MAG: hypothetical protein LAP21_14260 [Acidobacteriia bacterium]|nr:hypothetical protein [Terriglobia bacterium]
MFSKQKLATAAFFVMGMQSVCAGGSVTAVTSVQTETFKAPEARVELVRSTGTDILVKVIMINHGPGTFRLLRWNLPQDGHLTSALFEVTRDGHPVEYHGRMVKRRVTPADYISMEPGKEYSATLSLSQAYDVTPPGQYKVRYSVYNQSAEDVKKIELIIIDSSELVIERK